MLFDFPNAGTLENDCQVEVWTTRKLGIKSGHMIPEDNGRRHDVSRGCTVNLAVLAGGRVNNSLGGLHGMDSSLEGILFRTPTGDTYNNGLGILLGGAIVNNFLGVTVNDGLGSLLG